MSNSLRGESLKGERIAVAMSGGVDSSLTAALLKAQGAEVMGFTLQLYDQKDVSSSKTCCAGRDIYDAKQVAAQLDIPHYVLDYQAHFQRDVIDDFVASYGLGETPIPCTRCNEKVKFSRLLEFARTLGAKKFATGHYIDKAHGALYCAADEQRDQSYFLWTLTAAQLDFSLFPLGALPKAQVREMAAEYNLPVALKPDSQDICFVPSGNYADLVRKQNPEVVRDGDIVHIDGTHLGRHQGLYQFTIGQRRGLGVHHAGVPLYVVGLDVARARLLVGPRQACAVCEVRLKEINWIATPPAVGEKLWVRLRSTQAPTPAQWIGGKVILPTPQLGVARGQACVFYQKGYNDKLKVLGGGWIDQTDLSSAMQESAGEK